MKKLSSRDALKRFAMEEGAGLFGVASVEGFPVSVPPRPPQALLDGARAVIVIGIPTLRGALYSNVRVCVAQTRNAYNELDRIVYNIGRRLESAGFRAAPVPCYFPLEMTRETRGMVGDLSLRHAAVAAGLAVWGHSRLAINPEWGPRVRYAAMVTDAALESNPPLKQEFCQGCDRCIRACPVGAISLEGQVDTVKCLLNLQRYGLPGLSKFLNGLIGKPAEEQQRALREPLFWNLYQHLALGLDAECAECVKACPVGLRASAQ